MPKFTVKLLTAFILCLTTSCSVVEKHLGVQITNVCKNRAHSNLGLEDFITSRFHSNAPVRMGIVPFSVPANLSAYNSENPGLGNTLAWGVQRQLMGKGMVPIVEVFNRASLPGHKDEFSTGNFGSIDMAREAGYDLVMVGFLEPQRSLDTARIFTKIIEVEGGITVWYGESVLSSNNRDFDAFNASWIGSGETPSRIYSNELFDSLASCIVKGISKEPK